MARTLLDGPVYPVLLGALCGFVGFRVGWRIGNRWVLPAVQGLLGFVAFAAAWRAGGAFGGTTAVAAWVVSTSLVAVRTFRRWPQRVDARVLRARAYRESMLDWLSTGRGPEAEPVVTVRRHVRELALYVAAAFVSGNLLSLVLGAVLLGTMNAWVAHLFSMARDPLRVALLGWPCWSIVRVAAYVLLGSASAQFWAARLGWSASASDVLLLINLGATGILLDVVLKLTLSRPWGRWLAASVDLDARPAD